MTEEQIKKAILSALKIDDKFNDTSMSIGPEVIYITCHRSTHVAYDELRKLSEALHTTRIDLEYNRETPDWSEVTPGDPASFEIVILRSPAERNG